MDGLARVYEVCQFCGKRYHKEFYDDSHECEAERKYVEMVEAAYESEMMDGDIG